MIRYPIQNQWKQDNSGELFGDISQSYSINLDENGIVKVSNKSVSIYSSAEDADFDTPLSMFVFDSNYFILTADDPFSLSSDLTVSQIAGAPSDISNNSDAVPWNGRAYVTTNDDLVYWNASSWTTGIKTLTAGVEHPLEVFENRNSLTIGNGNTVLQIDTAHSDLSTLTLPSRYRITCIKYAQNNVFVGTRSLNGTEAKIFIWDGSSTSAGNGYGVGADWVFSIEEHDGGVVAVTSAGQLLGFTGGGFSQLSDTVSSNFPVYYTKYRWNDTSSDSRRIQRRGLKSDGDILYILIDGAVSSGDDYFYLPNQPSGLWCFDKTVGLYCRNLCTDDPLQTIAVSSLSSDTLTLASSINATTGEPVLISNVGSLTGISQRETYYIIKVSSTEIKLAYTPQKARDGEAISLGGSSGTAEVKIIGYTNYGHRYLPTGTVGCVTTVDYKIGSSAGSIFNEIVGTDIMWGFTYDSVSHLNVLSSGSNVGGFISSKISLDEASTGISHISVKSPSTLLSGEYIKVKHKHENISDFPTKSISGTYSHDMAIGSTSFYLDDINSDMNINLITGNGAGISKSVDTVDGDEILLKESVSNISSSDTIIFNVDNFKNLGSITNTKFPKLGVKKTSSSEHTFMVEMYGVNVRLEKILIENSQRTKL